jgi:quercetin dioxygenase-like cupin family protein
MTTDLSALARAPGPGVVWSQASEDLNLNLVVLDAGGTIAEHSNAAVDVLLVGVRGSGMITVNGVEDLLEPGRIVVIAKGDRRSISAGPGGLAYLTCHRRRPGLQPGPVETVR